MVFTICLKHLHLNTDRVSVRVHLFCVQPSTLSIDIWSSFFFIQQQFTRRFFEQIYDSEARDWFQLKNSQNSHYTVGKLMLLSRHSQTKISPSGKRMRGNTGASISKTWRAKPHIYIYDTKNTRPKIALLMFILDFKYKFSVNLHVTFKLLKNSLDDFLFRKVSKHFGFSDVMCMPSFWWQWEQQQHTHTLSLQINDDTQH